MRRPHKFEIIPNLIWLHFITSKKWEIIYIYTYMNLVNRFRSQTDINLNYLVLLFYVYIILKIPYTKIWLLLHRTNLRWRFCKILWPSQNIWTLLLLFGFKCISFLTNETTFGFVLCLEIQSNLPNFQNWRCLHDQMWIKMPKWTFF